jgi:hypothetical protein
MLTMLDTYSAWRTTLCRHHRWKSGYVLIAFLRILMSPTLIRIHHSTHQGSADDDYYSDADDTYYADDGMSPTPLEIQVHISLHVRVF